MMGCPVENNPRQSDSPSFEKIGDVVSIFQRGARWYANFQWEGKQQRPSLKTTSKKEARRRAIRLEAEILKGRFTESVRAPSVKVVTDAYVAYMKAEGRAKKTLQKIELVVRRVTDLAERRKAKTILDVNLRYIDAYRAERAAADALPKTILNESVIVRQIVNFALAREMIKSDPLKNLKLKKVKPRPQPCWTRAEVDTILSAAKPPHLPALTILAEAGMRVGEVKHLTWADVDFERSVLHVRPKGEWRPKTGDQRSIPINKALKNALLRLPKTGPWVVTALASSRYPAGGSQISERRLLVYLKRVLKRLGLRGHLHTFRHAFISHALTAGTPHAIVQKWVGHVDPDTMKLYTHINDAASQSAMSKLTADTAAKNGDTAEGIEEA